MESKQTNRKILTWKKIPIDSIQNPTARSGHTLTMIGSNAYLFGGITETHPPGPSDDMFQLKLRSSGTAEWVLITPKNVPSARWRHSTTNVDGKLFLFGGFHSSTNRFNDLWIFNPITMDWKQPIENSSSFTPRGNHIPENIWPNCPTPRGGHSACLFSSKLYIFGGYGGTGYGRRDFNDLFILDTKTFEWDAPMIKGQPPEKRCGHQACAVDRDMLVFGGWNAATQFNDLHILDTETNSWSKVDGSMLDRGKVRWNHSCCAIMAIPNWKVFVFGGLQGVPGEMNESSAKGAFMNDTWILDTGERVWCIADTEGDFPSPRSDTTLTYDAKGSRLLVFGGWANCWYEDLFSLDVGCIVGPPYAILSVHPDMGPITGGQSLVIEGQDFVDKRVSIRFGCKDGAVDVEGQYVDNQTLTVTAPDFTRFYPCDAEVRVALHGDSYTTTYQKYTFVAVTDANFCFAYGPGVLSGGAPTEPTMFILQTCDSDNKLRTTGDDEFLIRIESIETDPPESIAYEIEYQEKGSYVVSYTSPKSTLYEIRVEFLGTNGGNSGPIRGSPFRAEFDMKASKKFNTMNGNLVLQKIAEDIANMQKVVLECEVDLTQKITDEEWTPDESRRAIMSVKECIFRIEEKEKEITLAYDCSREALNFLRNMRCPNTGQERQLAAIMSKWKDLMGQVPFVSNKIAPLMKAEQGRTRAELRNYQTELANYEVEMKAKSFWLCETSTTAALREISNSFKLHEETMAQFNKFMHIARMFDSTDLMEPGQVIVDRVHETLEQLQDLWRDFESVNRKIDMSREILWSQVDGNILEEEAQHMLRQLSSVPNTIQHSSIYKGFKQIVKDFSASCPLIQLLRHPSMRKRHWEDLMKLTSKDFRLPDETPSLRLQDILALELHKFQEGIETIAHRSQKEHKQELAFEDLEKKWSLIAFTMNLYKGTAVPMLNLSEDDSEMLEADQLLVHSMMGGPINYFKTSCRIWHQTLQSIADGTEMLRSIQRIWAFLEPLFLGSEDVKRQLPEEAKKFDEIDSQVRSISEEIWKIKNVRKACTQDNFVSILEGMKKKLESCRYSLLNFLESKRQEFPKFYFISESDLLDLLASGSNPRSIVKHISKLFVAIESLKFDKRGSVLGWHSSIGTEYRDFEASIELTGTVEIYLEKLQDEVQNQLQRDLKQSLKRYPEQQRAVWLMAKTEVRLLDPAQIALLVAAMQFVDSVEENFVKLKEGNAKVFVNFAEALKTQLTSLIKLTIAELTPEERQRVACMVTQDIHYRDVVHGINSDKIADASAFQWHSQLKPRIKSGDQLCVSICDASLEYGFEYLGNGSRLVQTPLTDRVLVSATQSLHLTLACAATGVTGSGKTETIRYLAQGCGKACNVFNCSAAMSYQSLGTLFKGIVASGCWGCFDDFHRISEQVLSFCTNYLKSVFDALREDEDHVMLDGSKIDLNSSCGFFFTMLHTSATFLRLPERLHTLFRPVSVLVPDTLLIYEALLTAEGCKHAIKMASIMQNMSTAFQSNMSHERHYDFGLRGIKKVLVQVGIAKRKDTKHSELEVFQRILAQVYRPQLVTHDQAVLDELLKSFFPGMELDIPVDSNKEQAIFNACEELALWPDEEFRSMVLELEQVLGNRQSVVLLGPPGSGKTQTYKTLAIAFEVLAKSVKIFELNPNVLTVDELFGRMDRKSREWIDGLFARVLAEAIANDEEDFQWIVFDGQIEPSKIESMNTLMDDTGTLTLSSNEQIQFPSSIRLIFEVESVEYASPATINRCGVVYFTTADGYQWKSLVAAWVAEREEDDEDIRAHLSALFDNYVELTLAYISSDLKLITPIAPIAFVQTLLNVLNVLIDDSLSAGFMTIEKCFVVCLMWSIGATLAVVHDDGVNYRNRFEDWFRGKFNTCRFPFEDSMYNYFFNPTTYEFEKWTMSATFNEQEYDGSLPLACFFISTSETAAIRYWANLLLESNQSIVLAGASGTGKTVLANKLLQDQMEMNRQSLRISCNYSTTTTLLQAQMETGIVKRIGCTFGPPNNQPMIYYIEDLNLSMTGTRDVQECVCFVRQHLDKGQWYDREKWLEKKIVDCQYILTLNPKWNRIPFDQRLARHFTTFVVCFPPFPIFEGMYQPILLAHFKAFGATVQELVPALVSATFSLHVAISKAFRQTATKSHYQFSLRQVVNVFHGMLQVLPDSLQSPLKLSHLWLHELNRVYGDGLCSVSDQKAFVQVVEKKVKKLLPQLNLNVMQLLTREEPSDSDTQPPLLFTNFGNGIQGLHYDQSTSIMNLQFILGEALSQLNRQHHTQHQVLLYREAIERVSRLVRTLLSPTVHGLVLGVPGSGRSTLLRLAAFISRHELVQFNVSNQNYSLIEYKTEVQAIFMKAGLEDQQVVVQFNEQQFVNPQFGIYINELINTGACENLFPPDEKTRLLDQANLASWHILEQKVAKNLKFMIFLSLESQETHQLSRLFPAICQNTQALWFNPPSKSTFDTIAAELLERSQLQIKLFPTASASVSTEESPAIALANDNDRICQFLVHAASSIPSCSIDKYLELVTTFISAYRSLEHRWKLQLREYQEAIGKAEDLKLYQHQLIQDIQINQHKVQQKKVALDKVSLELEAVTEKLQEQKKQAEKEKQLLDQARELVRDKTQDIEDELTAAGPVLHDIRVSLENLRKQDLGQWKTLKKPPLHLLDVLAAVVVLFANINPSIPVQKNGLVKDTDRTWNAVRKALFHNITSFLDDLDKFLTLVDCLQVPDTNWSEVRPYLALEHFTVEEVQMKTAAGADICLWLMRIVEYHDILVTTIHPKRMELEQLQKEEERQKETYQAARLSLSRVQRQHDHLSFEHETLQEELSAAKAIVSNGEYQLQLIEGLVVALNSQKTEWNMTKLELEKRGQTITSDILLGSSSLTLLGHLQYYHRQRFILHSWIPVLKEQLEFPLGDRTTAIAFHFQTKVQRNELQVTVVLHEDMQSIENFTYLRFAFPTSPRVPFLIDPELVAKQWLQQEFAQVVILQIQDPKIIERMQQVLPLKKKLILVQLNQCTAGAQDLLYVNSVLLHYMKYQEKLQQKEPEVQASKKKEEEEVDEGQEESMFHKPELTTRLVFHTTDCSFPYHKSCLLERFCKVINFTLGRDQVQRQLLSLVVLKRNHRLQTQHWDSIKQFHQDQDSQHKKQQKTIELFNQLDIKSTAKEQEGLYHEIEKLARACVTLSERKQVSRSTIVECEQARQQYSPVATRAGVLYKAVHQLQHLNRAYAYSINRFAQFLDNGISAICPASFSLVAEKPQCFMAWTTSQLLTLDRDFPLTEEQVEDSGNLQFTDDQIQYQSTQIQSAITRLCFEAIRLGLEENDKLAFAFYLYLSITVEESKVGLSIEKLHQLIYNTTENEAGPSQSTLRKRPELGPLGEYITKAKWKEFVALEQHFEEFRKLCHTFQEKPTDWITWINHSTPEMERLPSECSWMEGFDRLLLVKLLRPDRIKVAVERMLWDEMGQTYLIEPTLEMEKLIQISSPSNPIFFVLSTSLTESPLQLIENEGMKHEMSILANSLRLIALNSHGDPERVANELHTTIKEAAKLGHWLVIENLHLQSLSYAFTIVEELEACSSTADPNFRCFLTSRVSEAEWYYRYLLENAIVVRDQLTFEGQTTFRRAWAKFSSEHISSCAKPNEYQGALFAICFLHSLMTGRKRFGFMGWNKNHTFTALDVERTAEILFRYLDMNHRGAATYQIPYADLRYFFHQIIYSNNHNMDIWDERILQMYLEQIFNSNLINAKELAPKYKAPDPFAFSYSKYAVYIQNTPMEACATYGVHPSTEQPYLREVSDHLFLALQKLDPASIDPIYHHEEEISAEQLVLRLPGDFDLKVLRENVEVIQVEMRRDFPFVLLAYQECARMNVLLHKVRISLNLLSRAQRKQADMTPSLSNLAHSVSTNQVPGRSPSDEWSWVRCSWPSTKPLSAWFSDLMDRIHFLLEWTSEFQLPRSLWLSGLFSPAGCLTAIKQIHAQENEISLESLTIETYCTPFTNPKDVKEEANGGIYVHGLFLQGAKWVIDKTYETQQVDNVKCGGGYLADPDRKELIVGAPVFYLRAVSVAESWTATSGGAFLRNDAKVYDCPVYWTSHRGTSFVFLASFDIRRPKSSWILAGVALLLQNDD